jgi:hypothetical protein
MTNGRCFGRFAAAAMILLATALPGAADGVSQFEQKIRPQLPSNSFTYANAKALGDNGFVLEDVVVTPPADAIGGAKAEPVAIKRVTVEDFDFAGLDKRVPLFLKIRVEGITVAGKPAAGVDLNKVAGIDHVTADFALDLYGAFSVKSCFWFVGGSLFEAGKPFFVPSPNDQVRGARGRGQGTETLAELSGLPLSRACVSPRLDA